MPCLWNSIDAHVKGFDSSQPKIIAADADACADATQVGALCEDFQPG